jgi:hypothetical protein
MPTAMARMLLGISLLLLGSRVVVVAQANYLDYHADIIATEALIIDHEFEAALASYERLFQDYDFIFLRDYKVAAQLALVEGDTAQAMVYVEHAIANGWNMSDIKKNELLKPLLANLPDVKVDSLIALYKQSLNVPVQEAVHKMYQKDQKMAIKALFRFGDQAKTRYNEEKFAPHSEGQMAELVEILETYGYPGEQLIGNDYWISTVLAHHNSISSDYNKNDTLYAFVRLMLIEALEKGQISPIELTLIEDWKVASESNHDQAAYGFLGPTLDPESLAEANRLREEIGLRSIELRNDLIDLEEATGIDFYLPRNPWQDGKIEVTE